MSFFFLFARVLRTAFVALRAFAGIMILSHGTYKWATNRIQAQ